MSKLKFAVAGTGWIAGEYARAIEACEDAELSAVVSSDESRARSRLKEWGREDVRVYTDFSAMVRDPAIDAAVLCSTADVRPGQAVEAARCGKHLVIEKPLAMDRDGLLRMAEELSRHPVRTAAGFVLRWNPGMETIKAMLEDDALGRVFMAQIDYWNHIGPQFSQYRWSRTRALGGSSMLSAGCHAVDALRWFAGEVAEVSAYSCRTWADSDYEFDPNAIAILKLRNGGVGKIAASLECRTPYRFHVHLLGEKGTVVNNRVFSHKYPGQTDYAVIPTIMPESGDVAHFPFGRLIAEFAGAIRRGGRVRTDFEDAVKTMEVCFAIDEAAATGRTVKVGG